MSSGIPTFSARKFLPNQPNAPSTLRKPTMIPGVRGPLSTKKDTQLSGLKRPSENVFSSQMKFRRTTPLSLARNKNVASAVKEPPVPARLTFNDNFKTPLSSRKGITAFDTDRNKGFNFSTANKNSFLETLTEDSSKSVSTEEKATSPIVDWSLITKESEINSYKSKIAVLEREIESINWKTSKARIDNEVKETKMKSEIEASQKIANTLREEVKGLKENAELNKLEMERLVNHNLEQTNLFEKQQLEYENQISELKEQLSQVESDSSTARSNLLSENITLKHRISDLENELNKVTNQMEIYIQNAELAKHKDMEIQRLKNELSDANAANDQLKDEIKSYGEGAQLKEILKGEISDYKKIKEENLHLKDYLVTFKEVREENLILHEKVKSFNIEIEQLKDLIQQKNVDLGEMNYNRQRINEWMQIVGADSPDIVLCQISELKQAISLLQIENDSLKSSLQSRNSNQSFQDMSISTLENKLSDEKRKNEQLNEALKKLNRKCLLYSKEKESYKTVINSYESEITINFEDITQRRIRDLEKINSDYQVMLQNYEQESKQANEISNNIISKEREIQELKAEIERIKTLNPHIYTNISFETSLQPSSMQTNEGNFRVLHLRESPLALKIRERADEYNNLKEENCRLKCLVDVLESGNVADMTRQINEGIQYRTESEKLKKDYDKLKERYNKIEGSFKKISKSFREACYHLTGYRIDNIANNRYKLTHAYDPKKRTLYFEVNNTNISMLQESCLASMQDNIDTYLTKGDSYPAFLAAFTLELFQNRSCSQSLSSMYLSNVNSVSRT